MKMSLGGQWRVVRHYLSLGGASAELLRRLRRDHWRDIMKKFEKAILVRLASSPESVAGSAVAHPAASEPASSTWTQDSPHMPPVPDAPHNSTDEDAAPRGPSHPAPSHTHRDPTQQTLSQDTPPTDTLPADTPKEGGGGVWGALGAWRGWRALLPPPLSARAWTLQRHRHNKSSLQARTRQAVRALEAAADEAARQRRITDLLEHLHRHPQLTAYARQQGAVRALLRARDRAAADRTRAAAEHALAVAGWAAPPAAPGPRLLSLDGGGIRGIVAVELLLRLERLAGRPVTELFELMVGVSTGAIICGALAAGRPLEEARDMYLRLARETFGGTSRLGGAGRLVWSHAYYDTAPWERLLRARLGERPLSAVHERAAPAPRVALVSCVLDAAAPAPFVFRSYGAGAGAGGAPPAARLWEAVRASAAAPTYFDEFTLDGRVHQDGGIVVNNPVGVALGEARALYGAAEMRRAVVVSVGTGRAPPPPPRAGAPRAGGPSSWRDKFTRVLESATDTEGAHRLAAALLPAARYYRLNPPLRAPVPMDETSPARLHELVEAAAAYAQRNQHLLERAAAALTRPRPLHRRAADRLRRAALKHGLLQR